MVKALLNNNHDGQVHLLKESLAEYTLCGKRLHPISTTYTPKLGVTCDECLGIHTATEKVFKITRCLDCNDHVHGNSHFCIIKRHRVISDPNKLADWCPRKGWTIKWSD